MSSEHFMILCKECSSLVGQCRCQDLNKQIILDYCTDHRPSNVAKKLLQEAQRPRIAIGGLFRCCIIATERFIAENPNAPTGTVVKCNTCTNGEIKLDEANVWRWEPPVSDSQQPENFWTRAHKAEPSNKIFF